MSYHTWHDYGYGICTDGIESSTTVERIETLLSHAPEFRDVIYSWFKVAEIEEPTVEDFADYDEDYRHGMAFLLKEVIKEAEGVEFTSCENFNCERFLIYTPRYPWEITVKDLSLTKEKIEEILKKYVSILTDEKIDIEYQEVENGG